MWRSVEDPPSNMRDVVVSNREGWYAIAFYDHWGKTWRLSEDMYMPHSYDIKLWCEIPKLNE